MKHKLSAEIKQNLLIAECYGHKARNARKRGIEFNMSLSTFANIKKQEFCAYSGIKFTPQNELSLERLDNSVGYVDGNVVPVLRRLNTLRGSLELADIDLKIERHTATQQCIFDEIGRIAKVIVDEKKKLAEWEKIPKSVVHEREKFVLTHNQINGYVNNLNRLNNAKRRIVHYDDLIKTRTALVNGTGKKKASEKRIEICKQELLAYSRKQILHAKQLKDAENMMKSIIPNFRKRMCKVTLHLDQTEGLKLAQRIESLERNLSNTRNSYHKHVEGLDDLLMLKKGLQRFSNLSDNDKMKLKMGLTLDTSTFRALKHKVGMGLLCEKL